MVRMRATLSTISVAALLALAACEGSESSTPDGPKVPAEGDAVIFQRILDGELDPAEGLLQIAQSDGLPIATSEGFVFAILDQGRGPFTLSSFNGRFPATAARIDRGVAWALVPVPDPVGARFDWASSTAGAVLDPLSRHVRYVVPNPPSEPVNQIQLVRPDGPHVERWPGVGDAKITRRTLRVWVPAEPPTHFMYAHDGQNLFNMVTPFGSWRLHEAAGPSTLVVGIDNSSDRVAEYTGFTDLGGAGGRGDDYADLVQDTVIPFVEARYGTPEVRGVMGSSLGGVISYHHALRHPGTFAFVASLSGTMGWGSITEHNPTPVEQWGALAACPAGVTFYLDSGGDAGSGCADSDGDGIEDDTPDSDDNWCENAQMRDVLETLCGAQAVHYLTAPGYPHSENSWRLRSPAILDLFEAL